MERSTMPPGWARAVSAYEVSWSQGKSGSREETRSRVTLFGVPGGVVSAASNLVGVSLLVLRWKRRDHRVVVVDLAHLGGAARRAEVVEEVDVGVVVLLPLPRGVVLVVDRLHRAHRFAGTAVDTLVGVDVEH